ncbi:nucleotide exchange factor GrpE [Streptomyces sp. FIT100]|uniref:nucleotide exchange factor GrpE n=1 Tax=Streptomyces sp. FIT100 TaxID=2837956 RepID=UPI0021C7271D|nr:nucleotide exchange factor GrpE [Streptomyces sp. FIT100]UUN25170.1 nucleotide exchange factor GrpE [Streptomyces sp. FIT100]
MNRLTDVRGTRVDPPLMLGPAGRTAAGAGADTGGGGGTSASAQPSPQEQGHGHGHGHEHEQGHGLRAELRERTADLQRLKAEYDNYRKRVRRDRLAIREIAVANVLGRLLPVLDALAEAREQGEVTGGFEHVARALETELAGVGLRPFGTAGDAFDPAVHEAVSYRSSDRFDRLICTAVLRSGYRVGEQLLRPARVTVAGPPGGP